MANAIGQPLRVRLKKPLPLDTVLTIEQVAPQAWQLVNGAEMLATATPATVEATVPDPPEFQGALAVAQHYPKVEDHELPHCFVCGPARAPGDGMRIFAAAVPGARLVAAAWVPDLSLGDASGKIKTEFVWAALDCPGAFATPVHKPMVLGEFAVRIERRPSVDERCVVIGWPIAAEGRKHQAGTALFGADRKLCALGLATWIELKG